MEKITKNQLAAMLLITDAFTLFCFMGSISLMTCIGLLTGTVLQFIMAVPLINLCKENPIDKSGKTVRFVYFLYLILWGGMLFSMLWKTENAIYIPYENTGGIRGKIFIGGLISAVCLYASSAGLKALSRSSVIAASAGAVCLLIVIISAAVGSDWHNFSRAETNESLITEISRGFVLSGGLGSFAVFLGNSEGNSLLNASYYFAGKALLTSAVSLTAVLVAGGIMKITDFPVVTAAQLSQPFSSQRIDSLFLMIFAVFAIFAIAVQSLAASSLLKEIVPKFTKFKSSFVLALMICSAFIFIKSDIYNIFYAFAVAAVLFFLPLIILLKRRIEN